MDKYEFNIKVEQIKKLVNKGDYETAMKIADTIDWRRVRSTSLLTTIAQVYERNAEYQDAKDILLLAFERAPIGKGLLFKLTDLALRLSLIHICKKMGDWRLEGCTMYITLEPCPMCAGAIVQARIPKVLIGSMNPKAGCAGSVMNLLDEKGFNHQVETEIGILGEECSGMLKEFFRELRKKAKEH